MSNKTTIKVSKPTRERVHDWKGKFVDRPSSQEGAINETFDDINRVIKILDSHDLYDASRLRGMAKLRDLFKKYKRIEI